MKYKNSFQNFLCGLAILLSIAGFAGIANAATIPIDVTATNKSGYTSKDPYSRKEAKSDDVQKFYITLTSLKNGPSMGFTSFNSARERVSKALTVKQNEVGQRKSHKYDYATALAGAKYYVYASAPSNFVDVHAVGRYCP